MAALTTPTPNSVIPSSAADIQIGTAGGTITIGYPVYLSTANTIIAANADVAGSMIAATVVGVALNSCVTGQRVMYCRSDPAFAHGFTVAQITPGAVVYLGDSAGEYTVTAADIPGQYIIVIGQINNPETTMTLNPRPPILGT